VIFYSEGKDRVTLAVRVNTIERKKEKDPLERIQRLVQKSRIVDAVSDAIFDPKNKSAYWKQRPLLWRVWLPDIKGLAREDHENYRALDEILKDIWSFEIEDVRYKKRFTMLLPRIQSGDAIKGFAPRVLEGMITDLRVLKRQFIEGAVTREQAMEQLENCAVGVGLLAGGVNILNVGRILHVVLKNQVVDILFQDEGLRDEEYVLLERIFGKASENLFENVRELFAARKARARDATGSDSWIFELPPPTNGE